MPRWNSKYQWNAKTEETEKYQHKVCGVVCAWDCALVLWLILLWVDSHKGYIPDNSLFSSVSQVAAQILLVDVLARGSKTYTHSVGGKSIDKQVLLGVCVCVCECETTERKAYS